MSKREDKLLERAESLKKFDDELRSKNCKFLAGVDEVGRGCLAGPVMSACVVLKPDFLGIGIDDSKKLSQKKREELFDIIMENAIAVGIGQIDNNKIDEINILNATKLAMEKAILDAQKKMAQTGTDIDKVIVDAVKLSEIKKGDGGAVEQYSVVKGDATSLCVAAASIIAKVTRDKIMEKYSKDYPEYGFENNKGYGTKAHYEGIEKVGITPIHRKTFLKKLL